MKCPSRVLALSLVGMVAVGVGCQSEPPAVPQTQQPTANTQVESAPIDAPVEAMTFVSLKVPNMV